MFLTNGSALEDVEEALERVRASTLQVSRGAIIGEGSGVMSSIAAIWGEEIVDPGEREPAVECNHERMLGTRRARLAVEALDTRRSSWSSEPTEDLRRR